MKAFDLLTIIQNAAKARIRSVPLPYTKASVGIAEILLNHGFIHSFTKGTKSGPSPQEFLLQQSSGNKRLWVDLKYGQDDRPILQHAKLISKPSRKVIMDCAELLRLVTGRRAKLVDPLRLGEVAIVRCVVKEENAERKNNVEGSIASLAKSFASSDSTGGNGRVKERYVDAKEAVGRGWGGEVVGRIG